MSSKNRFVPLNPRALRERRLQLGWTQRQLARAAGYSERLIRKAESGGMFNMETVHHLAQALSTDSQPFSPLDLTQGFAWPALQFMEAYDKLGCDMLDACRHVLADDFVWMCSGDCASTPFAGVWRGIDGLQNWLSVYFSIFTLQRFSLQTSYSIGPSSVSVRYVEKLYFRDRNIGDLWVNLHFQLSGGLIQRMEREHDTQAAAAAVMQCREV